MTASKKELKSKVEPKVVRRLRRCQHAKLLLPQLLDCRQAKEHMASVCFTATPVGPFLTMEHGMQIDEGEIEVPEA